MCKPLSLRKNFSWTFVANGIYSVCQWGMLIVLAKLGGPEVVGKYSLAVAIVLPITVFGRINLRTIFVTDVKNTYVFSEYFAVRIVTTVLTFLTIFAVAFLFYYNELEFVFVTLVVGLSYCALSFKEMFQSVMQKAERMDWLAVSQVIQGVFGLALFAFAVMCFKSLMAGVLSLLLVRCCVIFIYDIPRAEKIRPMVCGENGPIIKYPKSLRGLLKLIWLSFPMGVTASLVTFQSSIPRYFIKHYYNEAYLGYFSAMSALLVFGTMIVQALGDSASPRLSRYYIDDRAAYVKLVIKLMVMGVLIGASGIALAAFFGKYFLRLFFTAEYAMYNKEFTWIIFCGAFVFIISFMGYVLSAARCFKTQMAIWGGITIITGVLCMFFVPRFGIIGAAWSMAIPLILGCLFISLLLFRLVKRKNAG